MDGDDGAADGSADSAAGGATGGSTVRPEDDRGAIRRDEVNVVLIGLLTVMIVIITVIGLETQPSSAAPPSIPHAMTIQVTSAVPPSGPAAELTLSRDPDGLVVMTLQNLEAAVSLPGEITAVPGPQFGTEQSTTTGQLWSVQINDPGTTVPCSYPHQLTEVGGGAADSMPVTPPHVGPPPVNVTPGVVSRVYTPAVPGSTFFFVRLCWRENAPIGTDGQYLGAELPPVSWTPTAPGAAAGTGAGAVHLSETLEPAARAPAGGDDTSVYTIQSNPSPDFYTSTDWQWQQTGVDTTGTGHQYYVAPVYFTAVNGRTAEQESRKVFLSGILLGLAGGALLTLVAEAAKPLSGWGRRRRTAGRPGPGP